MRWKLVTLILAALVAFQMASNPMVSQAAGMITGKQIKNGSITGKDIKDGSVTVADVAGSITGPTGAAGPAGAIGKQGPAGVPGNPGVQGTSGISNLQTITSNQFTVGPNTYAVGYATCPAGTSPISGGAGGPFNPAFSIGSSSPSGNQWRIIYNNNLSQSGSFVVYAVCAVVS